MGTILQRLEPGSTKSSRSYEEIGPQKGGNFGLDPRYVDVAIERWQQYAGESAVLEEGGLSFESAAR
jgi:hypothetical protein